MEGTMHLAAKPPVFVPAEYRNEIEKLSKAALMDMVWDYCVRTSGEDSGASGAIAEFRATREIILRYRKQSA